MEKFGRSIDGLALGETESVTEQNVSFLCFGDERGQGASGKQHLVPRILQPSPAPRLACPRTSSSGVNAPRC